jgi:hypothetical protein
MGFKPGYRGFLEFAEVVGLVAIESCTLHEAFWTNRGSAPEPL